MKDASFHDYVVNDFLVFVPDVSSRAMFGGYAIYKNRKIFALIIDDALYMKADDETKKFFELQGSHPFTYSKKNDKTYTMNYWFVSEDVFEDRDKLSEWVDVALSAKSK